MRQITAIISLPFPRFTAVKDIEQVLGAGNKKPNNNYVYASISDKKLFQQFTEDISDSSNSTSGQSTDEDLLSYEKKQCQDQL